MMFLYATKSYIKVTGECFLMLSKVAKDSKWKLGITLDMSTYGLFGRIKRRLGLSADAEVFRFLLHYYARGVGLLSDDEVDE